MVKPSLPLPSPRSPASAIRELLAVTEQPHVRSLAGGLPHPDAVPTAAVAAATAAVLAEDPGALQYGPTEGHGPLRRWVAARHEQQGRGPMGPDGVLITAGAQQALDLVARTLVRAGSVVALADPAYVGALGAFTSAGAQLAPIPADADGLRVDALAEQLHAGLRPTLVYVVASADNPTGAMLGARRRLALAQLAEEFGFWIVDDDAYGELSWGPALAPTPLAGLSGRTVTLGSASKVLSPGLRVGWAVGPPELVAALAVAKQSADLQASSLSQRIVARVVADTDAFAAHLDRLRGGYRRRATVLVDALAGRFGDGLGFARPTGGMFVWATLAPRVAAGRSTADLLGRAIDHGVAYVPGRAFAAGDPRRHDRSLRLSFASLDPDELVEAVDRLGDAFGV